MAIMYYIERVLIVEFSDADWNPEFAGTARVWTSGPGSDENHMTVQLFPEPGYDYVLDSRLGSSSFPFKWPENPAGGFVTDIKYFLETYKPIETHASCRFMVVSQYHSDPELELYDYPFTILPLVARCLNKALGASVHEPVECSFSKNCHECPHYEEFSETIIGSVDQKPISLKRLSTGHEYTVGDEVFSSLKRLKDYCKENEYDIDITYVPSIQEKDPYYPLVEKRIDLVYA